MLVPGPADGSRDSTSTAAPPTMECGGGGGDDAAADGAGGGEEQGRGEVHENGLATSPEEEEEGELELDDLPPVLNVTNPVSGCWL